MKQKLNKINNIHYLNDILPNSIALVVVNKYGYTYNCEYNTYLLYLIHVPTGKILNYSVKTYKIRVKDVIELLKPFQLNELITIKDIPLLVPNNSPFTKKELKEYFEESRFILTIGNREIYKLGFLIESKIYFIDYLKYWFELAIKNNINSPPPVELKYITIGVDYWNNEIISRNKIN
jgi:hypothetical protein